MEPNEPPQPSVDTAEQAADLLGPRLAGGEGERIAVLHLDAARRLLAISEYSRPADRPAWPVREVLAEALRLGAAGLIVAERRAGGDADPAAADLEAARELADAGRRLGVTLYDHLIFAGEACSSMRGLGLL